LIALWLQTVSLISTHFFVPIAFLSTLATLGKKTNNRLTNLSWLLLSLVYISYIFTVGRWDWVGYYFRYVWIAGLLFAIYRAYRNPKQVPFWPERSLKSWFHTVFPFLLSAVFICMVIFAYIGRYYTEEAIALRFPLKNGNYYVAHGGNTPIVNYHNEYPPQQFALDIVKINSWGFRANGFYPDDLHKYTIYGDRLYSPCSGIVRKAVDGFEDRSPSDFANGLPEGTPAAGNYVVIDCHGAEIYIAHMQKGTVRVQEGDVVNENSWIGNVGNSGNTSEPHLHIHAERNGIGVPITFENRFLVRNNLFRSSE
jgi:hypothetical protein